MVVQPTDQWGRTSRSGNMAEGDQHERVMKRIRAVLALTNSPNENEAASAAAKLQELLTEHNLSVADLEAKGQKAPGMREQPHDLGKAAFKWKLDLAEGIAELYYCASLVGRTTKSVAFVGRPDNVEALTMLYEWVIQQVKDIARSERRNHFDRTNEHIDPLRWQVSFGEGAVERLIIRLKEMKVRQEEELSRNDQGDITGLVIHRQSEVSDYLEEKFGYRVDGKQTKKERESEARWAKWQGEVDEARAKKDDLRIRCVDAGDMEPYYKAYPEEHPDRVARRQAEIDRANKEYERKARRRTGPAYREPKVDEVKEGQARSARNSGRSAANNINLQPFLKAAPDRKKMGR